MAWQRVGNSVCRCSSRPCCKERVQQRGSQSLKHRPSQTVFVSLTLSSISLSSLSHSPTHWQVVTPMLPIFIQEDLGGAGLSSTAHVLRGVRCCAVVRGALCSEEALPTSALSLPLTPWRKWPLRFLSALSLRTSTTGHRWP